MNISFWYVWAYSTVQTWVTEGKISIGSIIPLPVYPFDIFHLDDDMKVSNQQKNRDCSCVFANQSLVEVFSQSKLLHFYVLLKYNIDALLIEEC